MAKSKAVTTSDNSLRDSSKNSRRPVIIGAGVVAAVLILVVVIGLVMSNSKPTDQHTAGTHAVKIERTSLVAALTISGTLGYGDANPLGGGGGIVTKVPEAGQVINAGQVVLEVEGVPVLILQSGVPLWRTIGPGVSGTDVAQLRDALAKLGINAGTAGDQTYDKALSDGIAQLYANAGYQVVPPTKDQLSQRTTAQTALTQAQGALSDAQAALSAAKNRKPAAADVMQVNNAVNDAQRALQAVQNGQCPSGPAPRCSAAEIAAAQDALNLAIAQRDDLNKGPDTTNEQLQVNGAQRTVTEAQKTYDEAMMNTAGPQTIIMVPEDKIRIDAVTAKPGSAADNNVLSWTRTTLQGIVDLTDAQRRLLTAGTQAVMTLSDGSTVKGTLASITEARRDTQSMQTIPARARIDIDDQTQVAKLGTSAVTVAFIQDKVEDTLVVPVGALLALAEGGYCVQRPDTSLVPVRIGLIADTRVQIFSDQLHEGDEVLVP